jgi:hypothetical protein
LPKLTLYKDGLEDDNSNIEDALDLLDRAVGGKGYTIEDGEPEVPVLTGEAPYLEVDAGLENNPTHSYRDLEEVLNALGY